MSTDCWSRVHFNLLGVSVRLSVEQSGRQGGTMSTGPFILHSTVAVPQYPSPLHGHRWITRPGLATGAGAPLRIHPAVAFRPTRLSETQWEGEEQEGGGRRQGADEETESAAA